MKNLIFINGTMGAGKSAVSRELKKILAPSFFLDGDWCWNMEPFVPGAAERALVLRNIAFLLNSYLAFDGRGNVIFGWVMHKRAVARICWRGLIYRARDFFFLLSTFRRRSLRAGFRATLREGCATAESLSEALREGASSTPSARLCRRTEFRRPRRRAP